MRRPERLHFAELFAQFASMLDSDRPAVSMAGRQLLHRLARHDPTWRDEVRAVLTAHDQRPDDSGHLDNG